MKNACKECILPEHFICIYKIEAQSRKGRIMSEAIQSLLDKIQQDGVVKAEEEKAKIIADAKAQAAKIIADAKDEAAAIVKEGTVSARTEMERANAAIAQAARDAVIALKSDLLARLNAVAGDCVNSAMTPEVMGGIIQEMAKNYAASGEGSLTVLLSKQSCSNVEGVLKKALLDNLKADPVIRLTNDFSGGLQISFRGDEVFFDFSNEALAEILCQFAGARLTALLKG